MNEALLRKVEAGIQRLAALDPDGAAELNDVGFAGTHTAIGHSLAQTVGKWTPRQAVAAYQIALVYRNTQLADLDLPVGAANEIAQVSEAVRRRRDEEEAAAAAAVVDFGLQWSEPREVVTRQGRRIVQSAAPTQGFWAAWRTNKEQLKKDGFSVGQHNGSWQVAKWTVPAGVKVRPEVPFELRPISNAEGLLPYQPQGASILSSALRTYNAGLDASDTGVGKTYQALAAVRDHGKRAIVVCPLSVKASWERAADHLGVTLIVAINYEKVRRGNTPWGRWSSKDQFSWTVPDDAVLLFDEAHRCKSHKSQNSKLLIAAKRQDIPVLVLSATAATNPLEMKALGYALGLHNGSDFWKWVRSYGCKPNQWGGFSFVGGPSDLAAINSQIFPRKGNRITVAALGDQFPETQITTLPVDLGKDTAEKADKIYREMERQLQELADRAANDRIGGQGTQLTIRLRARQKAELLKVPAFVELAEDFVAEGKSVAIFVNFDETLESVREKLAAYEPSVVKGGQTAEERQEQMDRFQRDEARIIICNIRAGGLGISLHDLRGNFARVSLISPTDSAVDLKQVFGRIWRAGGKSKSLQRIIGIAGSVEEAVLRNVSSKLNCLDALNDNDLSLSNAFSLRRESVDEMAVAA